MQLSIYHDRTQDLSKPFSQRDNFDAMTTWENLPTYVQDLVKKDKPHLAEYYHRNNDEPIYINLYFYNDEGNRYYQMNNTVPGWNRDYSFADSYTLIIPSEKTPDDKDALIKVRPQYSYYPKEGNIKGNRRLIDGKVVLDKDQCGQQSVELAVIYKKGITPEMIKTLEFTQDYYDGCLLIQQFIDQKGVYDKSTYNSSDFRVITDAPKTIETEIN